jgi:signal transduction histidine kinase
VAEPSAKPEEGFFREYSSLLIEKLEDQLITAEENARLLAKNLELQREVEARNAALTAANADLERANADLEAFSYSVSHDLRAPVRAIQGMLALLLEKLGPEVSPEAKFFASRIEHNAERMNTLIAGLLAHSRMRHVTGQLAPVDLNAVVASTLGGLDFAIREAGARVHVEGALPRVLAHEAALVQVVTNLVDNGVKFVPRGTPPEVRISATLESDRVRLNVRDNGIGIPAEYQNRLFQVFERLVAPDQYPGTGIGLAIVRRGIERMGGKVGVESPAPGGGSCFWIDLKAAG